MIYNLIVYFTYNLNLKMHYIYEQSLIINNLIVKISFICFSKLMNTLNSYIDYFIYRKTDSYYKLHPIICIY
jgi:hypothetical protein